MTSWTSFLQELELCSFLTQRQQNTYMCHLCWFFLEIPNPHGPIFTQTGEGQVGGWVLEQKGGY